MRPMAMVASHPITASTSNSGPELVLSSASVEIEQKRVFAIVARAVRCLWVVNGGWD